MKISAEKVILTAKQHKIEELDRLASSTVFVEVISNLIHSLQAERGASSLYIASAGKRFEKNKYDIIKESQLLETSFLEQLTMQLAESSYTNAKLLSLMAWVLLGLEDLALLRKSIDDFELSATECIQAYSRLISGLISLIFNLADTVIDPRISNLLVALFNLVQGKELAGQERAVGSFAFASGAIEADHLQTFIHLVENQQRLFEVFCDFAEPNLIEKWKVIKSSTAAIELEKLRAQLVSNKQNHMLDNNLSEMWFTNCSDRLTDMWELQCDLIHRIKEYAAVLVTEAETDLKNVKGLINSLRNSPPANANLADRFFDPEIPVELAFRFVPSNLESNQTKSMIDVLQLQSKRLADMEHELENARKALTERKTIEKAKGLMMSKFNLTEEDAYKRMRSSAMEQNKKLFDVAQTIISVSSMF
jgi:hypothetical protein